MLHFFGCMFLGFIARGWQGMDRQDHLLGYYGQLFLHSISYWQTLFDTFCCVTFVAWLLDQSSYNCV
jgi:hypothetical protein